MAIYFDNKILEPKADGTSLQKMYYEGRKEVKEIFDKFRKNGEETYLIFTRDYKKVWNTAKTSYKPAPPMAVPMKTSFEDPTLGSIELRYSKSPPEKSDNRFIWPTVKKSIIHENLVIKETDLDFAWFILKASNYVKNGLLRIVDKQQEYEGTVSKIRKEMNASRVIFDDDVSLEHLEALASLVLPDEMMVQGESKDEFSAKLWDTIVMGEKSKKPYNFDALINADKEIKMAEKNAYVKKKDGIPVSIDTDNGETINAPLQKCPPATKDETLKIKAEKLGFSSKNLSRDEIYSVIKFKEEVIQND